MSDSHHYFLAHAREAIVKARRMPKGRVKAKQRAVARVYHLLAKEAAYAPTFITSTISEKPVRPKTPSGFRCRADWS